MKLVLVGRKGWGKDKELLCLINDMSDIIVFTEYVTHECLVSLYHYAHAFALLSIYEGFGRTLKLLCVVVKELFLVIFLFLEKRLIIMLYFFL